MQAQYRTRMTRILLCFTLLAGTDMLATGFKPPVVYPTGEGPSSVTVGVFNTDDFYDLAVTNQLSNTVSVLLGGGGGKFHPAVNYAVGSSPSSVIATCEKISSGPGLLVVANGGSDDVSVLISNGDGTFQPAVNYSLGTGKNPQKVVGGDFDHDDNCDLAVVNRAGGTNNHGNVALLFGNGDGTFREAVNYDTLGIEPVSLSSADLNDDTFSDLAVANFSSDNVGILLNNGDGTFTSAGTYFAGTGPTSLEASHISFEVGVSLVVTNSSSNSFTALYNDGQGMFDHHGIFAAGNNPVSLTFGEFTHSDYLVDLAIVNENDSTVSVYTENRTPPPFRKPATFSTCPSPKSAAAVNLRPGIVDDLIIVCSNGVGVMLNDLR